MRKLVFYFFLFVFVSSCGESKEIAASLASDCTETYIRYRNVDWKVCNDKDVPLSTDDLKVALKHKDQKVCADITQKCVWHRPFAKSALLQKVKMPK
jgi:hypothetical protein